MIKFKLETKFVNREKFLSAMCQNKMVLHLGATASPKTEQSIRSNKLLHAKLTSVAKKCVGLDIDKKAIEIAKKSGITNIYFCDIEKSTPPTKDTYELIIAGEIFEHLNNPGLALKQLKKIASKKTKLIITVPNSNSIKNIARAFLGYELIHPDHLLHHSHHTLKALLSRHGFKIDYFFSYTNNNRKIATRIFNQTFNLFPQLAEGLGAVCSIND
jgi:2-polyprenyl-3-methyl-5-hydroxy-6-metoxy-1,4-benzoquinol methylase